MPVAISYARFSSAGQAEGSSLQRQIDNAEKYAAENGLTIDPAYSFTDLGVSAYDQSNVRRGALGLFLEAVQQGRVPKGSTLIVESFDRLSRAEPLDAFSVFTDIVNAGLTVAILTTPPKQFSRALITDNPWKLLEALIDMFRANAESKRKSDLVSSAWKIKRQAVVESGKVMSAKAPHWIDVEINPSVSKKDQNRRIPKLNDERAAVVLQIIEWAEAGVGNATIIKNLNASVTPWSMVIKRRPRGGGPAVKPERDPKWEPSYIQKLLTNPALYGAIEIDGELVEDYYPPVIDKKRYDSLRGLRSARATTKNTNRGGATVTNLFSGLMKCGYCGYPMNVAGYKVRKGRQAGYERKYVACHGARLGAPDSGCRMKMWFLDELEPTLLFHLDRVDFSRIVGTAKKSTLEEMKEALVSTEAELARLEAQIDKGHEAILEGVKSLIPKVAALEIRLREAKQLVDTQRQAVAAAESTSSLGQSRMKSLILLFKALKETTEQAPRRMLREQLSTAIHAVTTKIVLYPSGHNRSGAKEDRFIDVFFKNGFEHRIEPGEC